MNSRWLQEHLLHRLCTDKSKMIHNLVKLANTDETNERTETPAGKEQDDNDDRDAPITSSTNTKIAVVDGRWW